VELERGLAASLGRRVRRARYAAGRSQRDVAAAVGVSQSTISRIELGNGAFTPLGIWARVAHEVGLDLTAVLHTPFQEAAMAAQLRCHRSVVEHSTAGGWLGWTLADTHDPANTITILERHEFGEVAVIQAWDVIGDVEQALDSLANRIDHERQQRDPAARVSGAFVVPATGNNRRRFTETAWVLRAQLTSSSDAWLMALAKANVRMPASMGTIWTDAAVTRLRPLVPYVDCRCRHSARSRRT
jgi:transcriptional regulator with XRE-family HTH domain